MYNRNKAIRIVSILIMISAIIVIAVWIFNIPVEQTLFWQFTGMKFNTALCLLLLSLTLLLTQYPTFRYRTAILTILSSIVLLIAGVSLAEYIFSMSFDIDRLFVGREKPISPAYPIPGQMAFNTAAELFLLSLGFLMLRFNKMFSLILSQFAFHTVTIIGAVGVIGFMYGTSLYHSLLAISAMNLYASIIFLVLSITASLLNPGIGIIRLFWSNDAGDKLASRLFILITFLAILYGAARLQLQRSGSVSMEQSVAVLIVVFLMSILTILWYIAQRMNKSDQERAIAEAEVRAMNADLEKRVEQRSLEIRKSEEKYRSLIEQASDAIYVVDKEGNFTDVNDSTCKMFGYSRAELLSMNVEGVVAPEELKHDPVPHGYNGPVSYIRERTLIRKNGEIFDAEINVKAFTDERVMVIARDITDRKKMETELREAEVKFRTLAEKSMVGVYITQNKRFLYANQRFAEMFGYELQELMNLPDGVIDTIYAEESRTMIRGKIRARDSGKTEGAHYEAIGLKKDGTKTQVEFYGNRVTINGQPAAIGTALDITERKKAEELLKKSEANLQTILKTTETAYALFDTGLKVLAFNQMAINFVSEQYKHVPKRGDELPDFFPKHRFPQFRKFAADVLQGNTVNYEIDYPQPDGSVHWFFVKLFPISNDQKEILGMMMALDDITQRKNAEQELRGAYQEKNTILESIDDGFYAIDKNFIVTYWNKSAERIMKIKREKIVGKDLREAFAYNPERQTYFYYERAFKDQEVQRFELFNREVKLWFEVAAYPSDNGLSVYFKDISERKLSDIKLRELNENLLKQARELEMSNAELEQFAYVASHDLQEPLRMVTSFLDRLETRYADMIDEKGKQYIYFATDGAKRMRQLILDLLAFSRVGRTDTDIEDVDVTGLLDEKLDLYQGLITELKADVRYGRLPVVRAYKTPLTQVFQNLVSNSLKYRSEGVVPVIEITCRETTAGFEFSVKDNGIGIDPEYFDKIFVVFQRLHNKDEYSGTGMGLAITKKIIEGMGGKIWVESEEGKGSTFYFTLPKSDQKKNKKTTAH